VVPRLLQHQQPLKSLHCTPALRYNSDIVFEEGGCKGSRVVLAEDHFSTDYAATHLMEEVVVKVLKNTSNT